MKIGRKIVLTIVFCVFTIPFLFFAWVLINIELEERLSYGDVELAIINTIGPQKGRPNKPSYSAVYFFKVLRSDQ